MSSRRKQLGVLLLLAGLAFIALTIGPARAQSAFRSGFDHFTTAWPLDGAHQNVDCENCHVEGIFKGTPRECAGCHNRGGLVKATARPLNHIRSTAQCQDCHSPTSWAAVRRVDHTQVLGSCRNCHNGITATGKPPDHPPASNQCELCHRTNTWVITAFLAPASPATEQVALSAPPRSTNSRNH
ncbi:MAG: hypothetical protein E4H19_05530 [Chromatiales bacterium]|nr:MAG: hypothetical protein E4H19_05530 [Chromatiales bacterium]